MSVRLADLLADEGLNLVVRAGSRADLQREVRWCAVTELDDPRHWLQGGELVLTTGLRQRTAAAQRQFVRRVAERGAAAIGFGTGLSHRTVPPATLAAAGAAGLPILEVPYETPFIAVDRLVADRVFAAHYGRLRALLRMHDELTRALLSGDGLTGMVEALRRMVGAPVGVVDAYGHVFASAPPGVPWPAGAARQDPVEVGGTVEAALCTGPVAGAGGGPDDILPYAAGLVGLELARRQAVLAGRRELIGHLVEDIVRTTIAPAEAERRLLAFGVDVSHPYTVVLATSPDVAGLRALPGSVYPLAETGVEPVATAHLDDHLVVLVGRSPSAADVAAKTLAYVAQLGDGARVGVGGAYAGVHGLRWSFYEAREALSRGPGVNGREPLSLPGLLLASDDLPLADLGREVLAPLLDFDATSGAALVETLRAYLEDDGSVAKVAARLYVHRNTVRYRIEQIERLTGRRLTSTADRVQLWLALHAVSL
ncbi:PucR family transcriptional regulator [Dactylosporangium sp. CA-139066]|uniref:PucR family transcriptional regulator n=1 Tax=Dactylosporangium sp. CA-139066 TaxID=3239930 RepID=UPI003D8F20C4